MVAFVEAATGLAALILAVTVIRAINFLLPYFFHSSKIQKYQHGKSRAWAFVTGASDGVGRNLTTQLAANGFNVVLHGRNAQKLQNVVMTLKKTYPDIDFRIVVCDAGTAKADEIQQMVKQVEDLNITVLINNVGGGDVMYPLAEQTPDQVDNALNANARFPAQLTRCFLARFVAAPGPSLIINIGSLVASFACYASVYGGSKGFNLNFSASLYMEMIGEGLSDKIEVVVMPLARVTQAGGDYSKPTLASPSAETIAKSVIRLVGCRRAVVVPSIWHALQINFLLSMPSAFLAGYVVPIIRARSLEEREKSRKKA